MKRGLLWLVDVAAHLASPLIKVAMLLGLPLVRGWRLACLRAQVAGRIPPSTQFDGPVRGLGGGTLTLGEHCRLGRGVQLDTTDAGRIVIGHRVRVNAGTIIVSNSDVSIGDETLIGEYVSIRDANHGTAAGTPMRTQPQSIAAIHIGRDVWIGRGACILKGVTVGDGAVVGANSVVTRDVPAGSVFAGVPARPIGQRIPSEQIHAP